MSSPTTITTTKNRDTLRLSWGDSAITATQSRTHGTVSLETLGEDNVVVKHTPLSVKCNARFTTEGVVISDLQATYVLDNNRAGVHRRVRERLIKALTAQAAQLDEDPWEQIVATSNREHALHAAFFAAISDQRLAFEEYRRSQGDPTTAAQATEAFRDAFLSHEAAKDLVQGHRLSTNVRCGNLMGPPL